MPYGNYKHLYCPPHTALWERREVQGLYCSCDDICVWGWAKGWRDKATIGILHCSWTQSIQSILSRAKSCFLLVLVYCTRHWLLSRPRGSFCHWFYLLHCCYPSNCRVKIKNLHMCHNYFRYGDITPHGRNNKIFTCVFVLLGISLIGYCLSILGSVIVENDARMKLKHQKRMKRIIERVNTMKQTNDKKSVKSFPYVISLN